MQNISSVNKFHLTKYLLNMQVYKTVTYTYGWFHMKTCFDKGRNANLKKLKSRRLPRFYLLDLIKSCPQLGLLI